jgi:hemoglobin
MGEKTLYERLGGYDAIATVANALLTRLMADQQLARFWRNRAHDTVAREKQLLIDFLASASGGPVYYSGRSLSLSHRGLKIGAADWSVFARHLGEVLDEAGVEDATKGAVLEFVEGTRSDIVE